MAQKNRTELKNFFLKGRTPSQEEFQDLIDSFINVKDDGIYKRKNEYVRIVEGNNRELVGFFLDLNDEHPDWYISRATEDETVGFNIGQPTQKAKGQRFRDTSRLFISEDGNVGLSNTKPVHKLDVNGMIGMTGRQGNYKPGKPIPADSRWHDLVTGEEGRGLKGYHAFEVLATVEVKNNNYAITHATCVSSHNRYWFLGRSGRGVTHTQGMFSRWRNKIDLRWQGNMDNHKLQIRSRRNLGADVFINYNITKLL